MFRKILVTGALVLGLDAYAQHNFHGISILDEQERVEQEYKERGKIFLSPAQIEALVAEHGDLVTFDGALDFDSPVDCATNCSEYAEARSAMNVPCPTLRNPFKVCRTINRAAYWPIKHACDAARATSCTGWQQAVNFFSPLARQEMVNRFNAGEWQSHVEAGREEEYMANCKAFAIVVCTAIGAKTGGMWGAIIGTAAGATFISTEICHQSTHW